jgi:anti-sigma factor RsiW
MKPCADRKEAIALLATGALAASETAALRAHLQKCAACGAYASQLGAICAQLGESVTTAPVVGLPPGFHARLKHRIQSEQQAALSASALEALRVLFTPARLISAIAVLALGLCLALWMGPHRIDVLDPAVSQVRPPPVSPVSGTVAGLSNDSTLMAYQAAFNRSYEDFDALVTQNARRNSTADGMTLMSAEATRF